MQNPLFLNFNKFKRKSEKSETTYRIILTILLFAIREFGIVPLLLPLYPESPDINMTFLEREGLIRRKEK